MTSIDDAKREMRSVFKEAPEKIAKHPGLRARSHDKEQHRRLVKTFLAGKSLLVVAEGGEPPRNELVQDVDLTRLPGAPDPDVPDDQGSEKYQVTAFKYARENAQNRVKRRQAILTDWTRISTR